MKLLYRIAIRMSLFLIGILTIWAVLFYMTIMDEINDEVDDSLEDYSELIIMRSLAGEELPSKNAGSNNQYFLTEITLEEANTSPHISYIDSMVYIHEKRETEPARILTTIFKDNEERYYKLEVSTPTIEKDDLKEAILYWMIFLYVALLVVIIIVNMWVFYRSTRPLYVLLNWLDNYKVGTKNLPLNNNTDITEFKKLNESAVRNMERAEQLFEEQKQFIGNASHEMQTPLAICLNRLEMLMEDESLREKQLEELSKTYQTLEYITRLNKSLLLLSKIENKQFNDIKPINVNDIVKTYLEDFKEVYAYLNIQVGLKEFSPFNVRLNDSLASILISNLLKNSYVHNVEGGNILIEITSANITVKNSGQSYPLDEKKIFERFYQGSKKEGSTGLGLSLVSSICKLGNLKLRYYFENDRHCFEISN